MKIFFISDFFSDEVSGGAELVDREIINYLSSAGHDVVKIRSFNSKEIQESFSTPGYYIVSNFTGMGEPIKKELEKYRYCIYEHDHKYLLTRDPSIFPDHRAPNSAVINRSFYTHAEKVFCQSKKHKEVVEKNLGLNNVVNMGCSIWSEQELETLSRAAAKEKVESTAILKSENRIKGQLEASKYCEKNKIDFKAIGSDSYEQFIDELAKYQKFIFFPSVLESFSRLAVEARILGCQLITNQNLGCASEQWFRENKGLDLLDEVKSRQKEVLSLLERTIFQKSPHLEKEPEEITVILNSYRRPYNLEMQVKALREQSIKPVQIWLWVNAHEDNRDFDYNALDIDRIFRNDYNWKFYGRFAAALLSNTKYVAIFDDDTIPGCRWFENCIETMELREGILGSAGVILNDKTYVHHNRCGWPTHNSETTRVDLVGHAWFFKREWLQYLWREKPTTWDNGEDIQFSYLAQKYGNIQTFCPPHPADDRALHGSILGNELGIDDKATSTNSAVSHKQFFSERDLCVQTALRGGWKTVKGITIKDEI